MIRLKDVEMEYDNGTKAIQGVTLAIEDGEFVFLVGPSGSGKSTIIKLLTGEVEPCAGRIMINGFSVNKISDRQIPMLRRTLGVIFQDFRLIEKKTVYDNLAFVMGKVSFCDLQDRAGRIQLYARRDEMDEAVYDQFKKYDIGDIVGVDGEVFRTQRGEMSVRAKSITLLSKSLLPLPEKFHGLQDRELRYRQRYVDLIMRPSAPAASI